MQNIAEVQPPLNLQAPEQPVDRRVSVASQATLSSYHGSAGHEEDEEGNSTDTLPPARAVRVAAPRDLTWVDVAALIINKQIGSGIFISPYVVITSTNSKSMAIFFWVLGLLYTVINMWLYLEYARDLPYTGGELVYLDHCLPRPRLLAYCMYGFYFACLYNSAANSMQFGRQVLIAVSRRNLDYDKLDLNAMRFLAFSISTFVCLLLYFSTAKSQLMNKATAGIKLLIMMTIVIAGGLYINRNGHASDFASTTGSNDWTGAFLSVLFAYHGWENATYVTGDIPRYSTLRIGFIVAVFTVGIFYIAITLLYCYAFPMGRLEANYVAEFFGGGDKAEMAAAILVVLSSTGSMISVAYTCVRVKQTIGWTGVLPWSSIWRRSAPLRPKYQTLHEEELERAHLSDELPMLSRGTPEGGIILHWIVSLFFVLLSIGIHPVETAISFAGPLLVYGHFFVSVILAAVFPFFKRVPPEECPTPGWKAPPPPEQLETWWGRSVPAFLAFAFSIVVIVCVPISRALRYNLYAVVGVLGYSLIHYALFVHPRTSRHVYNAAGFDIQTCVHGVDDGNTYERQCEICHSNPNMGHRHAQEGYLKYNAPSIRPRSGRARFLYRFFGGSNKSRYLDIRLDNYNLRLRPRWMKMKSKPAERGT